MLKALGGAMLLFGGIGAFLVGMIIAANMGMQPANAYLPTLLTVFPWLVGIAVSGIILGAIAHHYHTRDYF
jgi:hypothetical protein